MPGDGERNDGLEEISERGHGGTNGRRDGRAKEGKNLNTGRQASNHTHLPEHVILHLSEHVKLFRGRVSKFL